MWETRGFPNHGLVLNFDACEATAELLSIRAMHRIDSITSFTVLNQINNYQMVLIMILKNNFMNFQ